MADGTKVSALTSATTLDGAAFLGSQGGVSKKFDESLFERSSYPKGAAGDGTTDDTAAIADWAAQGGYLCLEPGATYKITDDIPLASSTFIDGRGATIVATNRIASYFSGANKTKIAIRNVVFDMSQPTLPTYSVGDDPTPYNVAIDLADCTHVSIEWNEFKNLYTWAIYALRGVGSYKVNSNLFKSPAQLHDIGANFTGFQTFAGTLLLHANRFECLPPANYNRGVSAFFSSGTTGEVYIDGNYATYCGRGETGTHPLGVFTFYGHHKHARVTNNIAKNCLAEAIRFSDIEDYQATGNSFQAATIGWPQKQLISIEATTRFSGVILGTKRGIISGNRLERADSSDIGRPGIVITAQDFACPVTDLTIHDNTFVGMRYDVLSGGPFEGVTVKDNKSTGNQGGTIGFIFDKDLNNGPPSASLSVTEAQSAYANLTIEGNISYQTGGLSTSAVLLNFGKSPAYSGRLERLSVEDNTFSLSAAGSAAAIVATGNATGTLFLSNNKVKNYNSYGTVTSFAKLVIDSNDLTGTFASTFSTSSVTTTVDYGNSWNAALAGLASGTATLSFGSAPGTNVVTATVTGQTNIASTSHVQAWIQGSTASHNAYEHLVIFPQKVSVACGDIVAGTGFTIYAQTEMRLTGDVSVHWQWS